MSQREPWEQSLANKIANASSENLPYLRETIEHGVGISSKHRAWRRLAALWSLRRAEIATSLWHCHEALALRRLWPKDMVEQVERAINAAQFRLVIPASGGNRHA